MSAQGALCMLCEVSHNSSEVFISRCQMLLGESASQGRVSRPPNRAFSHPPRSMSSVCGGAVIVALRRCRRSASLEAHAACCIGIPPSGGARVSLLGSRLHVIFCSRWRDVSAGCAIQLADTRQLVICVSPQWRDASRLCITAWARGISHGWSALSPA